MRLPIFGIATFLLFSAHAKAGEFECFMSCDIGGLSSIEWKPSGCYKPDPPSTYVFDANGFDEAVDDFNRYVSDVETYLACMVADAQSDINQVPNIISDSVQKLRSEVISEVDSARSSLESARMLIQ